MTSSTKPYGTTGGKLSNAFPTEGRYGGESVAERKARAATARNETGEGKVSEPSHVGELAPKE